jgi:hypothetical protein
VIRRVGVLSALTADDPEGQARVAAFREALQKLGWADGRNLQLDVRWSEGDAERLRKNAADFAALAPDVILGAGNSSIRALLQATRSVPVVFVTAADPSVLAPNRCIFLPHAQGHLANTAPLANGWNCSSKGLRPAEMPVQAPPKSELVIIASGKSKQGEQT